MIALSASANSIKFFNTDEENYWLTPVKNGPDRGNFARYIPNQTAINLFFDADAALTFLDLIKCGTNTILESFATSLVSGSTYKCIVSALNAYPFKVYLAVRGSTPFVISEQFYFIGQAATYPELTVISYKNVKTYAGIPANQPMITFVNVSFWMQKNPQTYESIEVSPGEFVRLSNEIHRTVMLETDFYPAYLHELIQIALGFDEVIINEKEWVMRNDYTYPYSNKHYALAKGSIELTERKSILRNTI